MNQFSRKTRIIEKYLILIADEVSILLSYLLAVYIRYHDMREFDEPDVIIVLGLFLFCVLFDFLIDWNRFFFQRGLYKEFVAILKYMGCMAVVFSAYVFLAREGEHYSRLVYAIFLIVNTLFTYLFHNAIKKFMWTFYKKSRNSDKVMIITYRKCIEDILAKIKEESDWSYEISGLAIMDKDCVGEQIGGISVVANEKNLFEIARQNTLDTVFVHLPDIAKKELAKIINTFELMGITCHQSVEILNDTLSVPIIGRFAQIPVITYSAGNYDYRRMMFKRLMDIAGGLVGLAITAVFFPFVAIAIKISSPGPIFFGQIRIGKNGRRFKMYKFRSMYVDAEKRKAELMAKNEMSSDLMFKMENDPRITPVGKFLRKTSIDELPQFFNVLRGDMSLVGTRPPTEDEFEKYSIRYRRRLSLTPGLTGMWQVRGRSKVTDFEDVMKYDLEYIDNWSLGLDIKLLIQTIGVVLTGKGAK